MKRAVILILLLVLTIPISTAVEIQELFTISGSEEVEEFSSGEPGVITYFYSGKKLLATKELNGQIEYKYQDRLGSDINTKTLPFGQEISSENRFSFTGKERDESGLYYFGARYYDSDLGKFTSIDPVSTELAYAYVSNNPMNLVDPFGRESDNPYQLGQEYNNIIESSTSEFLGRGATSEVYRAGGTVYKRERLFYRATLGRFTTDPVSPENFLMKEYQALVKLRLNGFDFAPRAIGLGMIQDSRGPIVSILAKEYIEGKFVSELGIGRFPRVAGEILGDEIILARSSVGAIGDINVDNVILTPDGRGRIIDFFIEGAATMPENHPKILDWKLRIREQFKYFSGVEGGFEHWGLVGDVYDAWRGYNNPEREISEYQNIYQDAAFVAATSSSTPSAFATTFIGYSVVRRLGSFFGLLGAANSPLRGQPRS